MLETVNPVYGQNSMATLPHFVHPYARDTMPQMSTQNRASLAGFKKWVRLPKLNLQPAWNSNPTRSLQSGLTKMGQSLMKPFQPATSTTTQPSVRDLSPSALGIPLQSSGQLGSDPDSHLPLHLRGMKSPNDFSLKKANPLDYASPTSSKTSGDKSGNRNGIVPEIELDENLKLLDELMSRKNGLIRQTQPTNSNIQFGTSNIGSSQFQLPKTVNPKVGIEDLESID